MDVIKGAPTAGLTYDPNSPIYWDPKSLHQEVRRVFEICNGCRLASIFVLPSPTCLKLLTAKWATILNSLHRKRIRFSMAAFNARSVT